MWCTYTNTTHTIDCTMCSRQFDWSTGLEDVDDSKVYFSPDLGNVIFASSLDGWGFRYSTRTGDSTFGLSCLRSPPFPVIMFCFRISNFSAFLATKMGMKEVVLNKTLWGDYYIKSKQVFRGALANAKKPLFVKLVLDNLWKLYEVIAVQRDKEQVQKIAAGLGIRLLDRDARQSDPKVQLHAILGQWMPLSSTTLYMVPSPTQLPEERTKSLMSTALTRFESLPADTQALHADFQACSSAPEAPVIVCISKMFPFEAQNLPQKKERQMTDEEMIQMRDLVRKKYREKMAGDQTAAIEAAPEESNFVKVLEEEEDQQDETVFIAFARVFSGTLRRGQEIFVLGPKYNPELLLQAEVSTLLLPSIGLGFWKPLDPANLPPDLHVTSTTVKDLYLLMGRDLEAVPSGAVPAGNLVGIGGLEGLVLKTATLSTSLSCPPFTDLHTSTTPILRVALQPTNAQDMPQLKKGVRLLNQADPCVQVIVQETGELVLVTAGEVHLERCLLDLRERLNLSPVLFARIEIDVSPPIVPFRETIIHPPKMDKVNEIIEDSKPPEETCWDGEVALSPDHKCLLRIRAVPLPEPATALLAEKGPLLKALQDCSLSNLPQQTLAALSEVQTSLAAMLTEEDWPEDTVSKVWSLGPRRCGPNLLINRVEDYPRPSIWELNSALPACDLASLDSAIETGFQLATLAGPMCEEPMMGVAFVLEHCSILGTTGSLPDNMGACTGQVITAVKEGCRKAFQTQPQRLMAAMYSCDIQVTSEVLGEYQFLYHYYNINIDVLIT
ncbi:EFTUD1 [Cordylochernes scorpioides]|uniref:EFTUD1 n=1 Tax=Cordylochernes scorpioides TaxID=51811 RepID=A0ABY6KUB5_9ARAC|nr:EFTUD1 [Cordylochernes scorpioides]